MRSAGLRGSVSAQHQSGYFREACATDALTVPSITVCQAWPWDLAKIIAHMKHAMYTFEVRMGAMPNPLAVSAGWEDGSDSVYPWPPLTGCRTGGQRRFPVLALTTPLLVHGGDAQVRPEFPMLKASIPKPVSLRPMQCRIPHLSFRNPIG